MIAKKLLCIPPRSFSRLYFCSPPCPGSFRVTKKVQIASLAFRSWLAMASLPDRFLRLVLLPARPRYIPRPSRCREPPARSAGSRCRYRLWFPCRLSPVPASCSAPASPRSDQSSPTPWRCPPPKWSPDSGCALCVLIRAMQHEHDRIMLLRIVGLRQPDDVVAPCIVDRNFFRRLLRPERLSEKWQREAASHRH
jgi:hypothetical protein